MAMAQDTVQILIIAHLGLLTFVLGIVVYRLTLHPLAKYPGPILGRITDFYSVYQAWAGYRHLDFYQLHQKYGDVVRYGPNSVSFNTNTALHEIYNAKANNRKAHFYSAFPASKDAWNTHNAIDKGLHARKKRVLSQAFSESAIRGLQSHMLHVIRKFCDAIMEPTKNNESDEKKQRSWSTPKNMAEWTNYMSYDVLGEICYGKSFDTLQSDENRFAIKLVEIGSTFHYLMGQMPLLKKLGADLILFPGMRKERQRFMAYSKGKLAERMAIGADTDRRDFFYYLLKARDPESGKGFAIPELWGESNVLLIAGSDTTSTALSATFFFLLHNPSTLTRLAHEIRSTFTTLEAIVQSPLLSSCRYLRACIDEAMRLAPPSSTLLPREVLPGGMLIDGHALPAGTVVGVPVWALHHAETYFSDPFAYKPERWLPLDTTQATSTGSPAAAAERLMVAQSAFAPFSIGPRSCIGKNLAYLELTIALARVLWLYDVRLAPGWEGVGRGERGGFDVKDIFVGVKTGPVVQFRKRC